MLTLAFFEAIARIPLGVAVTIEFLGPLGVALAGSRRAARRRLGRAGRRRRRAADARRRRGRAARRDGRRVRRASPGACWAGYILLTKRVGARWAGLEGPVGLARRGGARRAAARASPGAGGELLAPEVLLAGIGLALLIPLLPYAFELIALRRLPTALFGVIMSLEPAIAALLGFALLSQALAATGVAGDRDGRGRPAGATVCRAAAVRGAGRGDRARLGH